MTIFEPGTAILVTGASGAIGHEIAAQAAAEGATVGVHGSSAESAAAAIARLSERVPAAQLAGDRKSTRLNSSHRP